MTIKALYPALRPTLDLNFTSGAFDPRITFTRASTAAYYDGKTVALAEQNLLARSQEFNDAVWAKAGLTATADTQVAPDGSTTADTLTGDGTNTQHRAFQGVILVSGTVYTFSVFAKAGTNNFIQVLLPYTVNSYANFDLGSGAVGTVGSAATATISSVGSGWYRCTITLTAASSAATNAIITLIESATAAYFTANTLATTVHIWGAQLEQRSSATAYTPTTTVPITNYIPRLLFAPANTPRIDHDPITGVCRGLLIEESRTNLLTYSEDFGNAAWVKDGATVTTNSVIAPDSTLTADLTVFTGGNLRVYVALTKAATATTYALSVYAKHNGGNDLIVYFDSGSVSNRVTAAFRLSDGVISGAATAFGTFTGASATITPAGNGWYRCTVAGTTDTGTAIRPHFVSAASPNGIYVWGAQLEAGAFPTSYIPTVASTVTRSRDAAVMPTTGWFDYGGEGTMCADFDLLSTVTTSGSVYFGLYGSSTITSGDDRGFALYNNTFSFITRSPLSTIPILGFQIGRSKVALAVDGAGKYGSKNGGAVASSVAAGTNVVTGATHLTLGGVANGALCQYMRRLTYYPKRLSNTELQAITV